MTDKQRKNLIRLLKSNNPASRNLGKVLLQKSSLPEEEKKQIENECSIALGWRIVVANTEYIQAAYPLTKAQFEEWAEIMEEIFFKRKKTVKPKVYNTGRRKKK